MTQLDQETIVDVIDNELRLQKKTLIFTVSKRIKVGRLWRLILEEPDNISKLDESLEGAQAWWNESSQGFADVLTVIPEELQIILRFSSADPPDQGQKIFVRPMCFLQPLKEAWEDQDWFFRIEEEFRHYKSSESTLLDSGVTPDLNDFDWLRDAQKEAFGLFNTSVGFLWGPPGTGKTTTLGVMLASYLRQYPHNKTLLISTTNVALDQALVSVDKALESISETWDLRNSIKRIGNHFRPEYYKERKHLLPTPSEALIQELIRLEAEKPDPTNAQLYADWKEQYESIRKLLKQRSRDVIQSSKLCAITSTRATFELSLLRDFQPFDLMVFDESSQMSQVHALALSPLAKQVFFAGDPKQLSPIFQSDFTGAELWLGQSMFKYMQKGKDHTVMLSEQSRMMKPICDIVSRVFYDGKLVVAKDKKNDPDWIKERTISTANPVTLLSTENDSTWSHKYGGPIRFSSASTICGMVAKMINDHNIDKAKIAVLSPFRAQRRLIKSMLRNQDIKKVLVSTVHRVQGSERHMVIFDPVDGSSNFLQDENGMRLINVAISRAMACLVIFLSPDDCGNPILNQIKNMCELSCNTDEHIPYEDIIFEPHFPRQFIGKIIRFPACSAKIIDDLINNKIVAIDIDSGKTKKFDLNHLREKAKENNQ